jgi:hypothetical protein
LDALLSLTNTHDAFREELLDPRRHDAEGQAALRPCDAACLAFAVRTQRHA